MAPVEAWKRSHAHTHGLLFKLAIAEERPLQLGLRLSAFTSLPLSSLSAVAALYEHGWPRLGAQDILALYQAARKGNSKSKARADRTR